MRIPTREEAEAMTGEECLKAWSDYYYDWHMENRDLLTEEDPPEVWLRHLAREKLLAEFRAASSVTKVTNVNPAT